jgi:hypothetical protein
MPTIAIAAIAAFVIALVLNIVAWSKPREDWPFWTLVVVTFLTAIACLVFNLTEELLAASFIAAFGTVGIAARRTVWGLYKR